jgi:hypothetical protein
MTSEIRRCILDTSLNLEAISTPVLLDSTVRVTSEHHLAKKNSKRTLDVLASKLPSRFQEIKSKNITQESQIQSTVHLMSTRAFHFPANMMVPLINIVLLFAALTLTSAFQTDPLPRSTGKVPSRQQSTELGAWSLPVPTSTPFGRWYQVCDATSRRITYDE